MSISKWRNQSGHLYAYEIISHYDPVAKQSRPKKVYLGRVNDKGEIIPTTGKRGRPRKSDKSVEADEPKRGEAPDYKKLYSEAVTNLKVLEARETRHLETIRQLHAELDREKARAQKLDAFIKRICEQAQGLANA